MNKTLILILILSPLLYFLLFIGWESEIGLDHWPGSLPMANSCDEYKPPKNNEELYNFIATAKENKLDRATINCVLAKSKYHYSRSRGETESEGSNKKCTDTHPGENLAVDFVVRLRSGLTHEFITQLMLMYDKNNNLCWFNLSPYQQTSLQKEK